MKNTIYWIIVILIVIIGGYFLLTPSEPVDKGPIKIGVINPETGPGATTGYYTKQGIELAKEEINEDGGIDGRMIEIFYEDSKTKPSEGVLAINKLKDVNNIDVAVSFLSSVTTAVAKTSNDLKIPLFVTVAAADQITDDCEWCIRYFSNTTEEGKETYNFISTLDPKKVAILHTQDDWGVAVANTIKTQLEINNPKTQIMLEKYNLSESDYRTQLIRIKQFSPDLMYFNGYEFHTRNFYEQLNNLEINIENLIVHVPSLTPNANLLGYMEGDYVTNAYFYGSKDKRNVEFKNKYKKEFNEDPSFYSSFAYDIVYLIKESIENSDSLESSDIIESAKNLGEFEGVNGEVSYNGNNHASPPYGIVKIQNGEFVKLEK